MLNKIIVAIDNSSSTQQVFDRSVYLAKAIDANLMLLHVLSPLDEQYIDTKVFTANFLKILGNHLE